MKNLIWLLAGFGLLIAGLPLLLQKVPPNRWYGFRLPKTLANRRLWYAANRTAGFDLCLAELAIVLSTLLTTLLALFLPLALLAQINFAVFWLALGTAVVHSFWTLSKL